MVGGEIWKQDKGGNNEHSNKYIFNNADLATTVSTSTMESLSVIVSPLLQVVFERITSSVLGEVQTHRDSKKEMAKLQSTLQVIQAVIEDAEEQQVKDKKVRIWLVKLKDVAYDADQLLDKISSLIQRKHVMKVLKEASSPDELRHEWYHCSYPRRERASMNMKRKTDLGLRGIREWTKHKARKTCLTLESISTNFQTSAKVKEIRQRLDDVQKEMSSFQFKRGSASTFTRSDTIEKTRETGPFVDESKVYGREEDVEKIVEMLLKFQGSSSVPQVPVIPIVGIGGMGKTTLAQLVYNDPRVKSHFELRMWVTVNDNFSPRRITIQMLGYITKGNRDTLPFAELQSELSESLLGKRYLLVLDDVWNNDQDEWDKAISSLKGAAAGSKIILTTRSEKVAAITSTFPPYQLAALSKDDCWKLLKQRAFAEGTENDFQSLLLTGEQIADKCRGVPLVAKILGSLLRFTRNESDWLHVQRSDLWGISINGGENKILSILRLSYTHLPSHLKPCFAYCSVFPKNFEINEEKLIQQWIAHDLIHKVSSLTLEDIGNEYFNNMLMMSFFQGVGKSDDTNMTEFKMHDCIHDLAKLVAGEEFLTVGDENLSCNVRESHYTPVTSAGPSKTRHASVVCNSSSDLIPKALCKAKRLRTLNLLSPKDDFVRALPTMVETFKHLRVLTLSGCGTKRLHRSIGGLIFLRYLDVSNTLIETMPETICDLCNLQTLNLSSCSELTELPSGTKKLLNLRHLNIDDCARLATMPPSIGMLKQLQTLPVFIVSSESCFCQLLQLNNLRGKLKIKCLENAFFSPAYASSIPARAASNIRAWVASKQFHSLELLWGNDDEDKLNHPRSRQIGRRDGEFDEILLDSFEPKPFIRRLSIKGFLGTKFPSWMSSSGIENLTELNIICCKRCESLPTLGQLPLLKILNIQGMDSIVNIGVEFSGEGDRSFPSLKELTLGDFPELKSWSSIDATEAFTCLDRLIIKQCPLLESMPCFPCLQYLELHKCNQLVVRSASELHTLSTLVIDVSEDLCFIPKKLLQNNSRLMKLTVTSCPRLSSMPENLANLTALKSLEIGWCNELDSLPHGLKNLTSLERLDIIECPSLISFPEEGVEGLCSLQSFSIENCPSLTSLPMGMKQLTALEILTIMYLNMAHLPDSFQYLSALRRLSIIGCPELTSLPEGLQHIQKIQSLEIHSCPKFMELPEWVKHLVSLRSLAISDCPNIKLIPEGVQHLSALQHLSIRDCPDLEQRCARGKGEDWQKISHIPYIYVGSSAVQQRQDIASTSQNP